MIVYKITNLISYKKQPKDKFYIGITIQKLQKRFEHHCNWGVRHITNAIKKYGKNNFEVREIDTANSIQELKNKEKKYIKKLKPYYNHTLGGDGVFGYKHTEESKRKIGLASKNRKATPETIKKLSGINNHNYGKPAYNRGLKGVNSPLFGKKQSKHTRKLKSKKSKEQWKKYKKLGIKNNGGGRKWCIEPKLLVETVKNKGYIETAKIFNTNKDTIRYRFHRAKHYV
jgi:group I intron endonuclease